MVNKTKSKLKEFLVEFIKKSLDDWERKTFKINSYLLGIIVLLYMVNSFCLFIKGYDYKNATTYFTFICLFPKGIENLFQNIVNNIGNIMSFGGALITLNGVFLTLLVTLKESPLFKSLKMKFPELHNYMYTGLKKQLFSCIQLMFICIIFSWFNVNSVIIELIYIVFVGYHLSGITLGALYNIKVLTDITTKEEQTEKAIK